MQRIAAIAGAIVFCTTMGSPIRGQAQTKPQTVERGTFTSESRTEVPQAPELSHAEQLIAAWGAYPEKFTGEITGYVLTTYMRKPYANRDRDTIIRYQQALENAIHESKGLGSDYLEQRLTELDLKFLPGSRLHYKKQNRFQVIQQGSDLSTQHFRMSGGTPPTSHHVLHNGKEFYKSTDYGGYTQINVRNTRPIMLQEKYNYIFWIPREAHSADVKLQRIAFEKNDSTWVYHSRGFKSNISIDDGTSLVTHLGPPVYEVLLSETFQSIPVKFTEGLVFPKLIIHVRYTSDNSETIERVTTYVIESVKLRDMIPDEAFTMPVEEGDHLVIGEEKAGVRPNVSVAERDLTDLETYLTDREPIEFK